MSSTTTKPPKRMRLAQDAKLIPVTRVQEWHNRAVMTPGLNVIERGVLDAIAEWYRQLAVMHYAGSLSHVRIAQRLDTDSVHVRWAVNRLVALGQQLENPLKNPALRPAAETLMHALPIAEARRQIAPRNASSEPVQNGVNEQP